mmetsp:Transcript_25327/g.62312  ORF Transcript_25327/g.62312 Transcript_25327/m.62312 type:complete len:146 (-) Transcript_25327:9-446(-)
MMVAEVDVMRAQHLPKMDTFGSIDAFVEGQVGPSKAKTKVIKNDMTPHWDEKLVFVEVREGEELWLRLYDWDSMTKNDLVGECVVPLSQMGREVTLPLMLKGQPVIGKDKGQAEITMKCTLIPVEQYKARSVVAPPPPSPSPRAR